MRSRTLTAVFLLLCAVVGGCAVDGSARSGGESGPGTVTPTPPVPGPSVSADASPTPTPGGATAAPPAGGGPVSTSDLPQDTNRSVEVAWVPPGPLGVVAPTCPPRPTSPTNDASAAPTSEWSCPTTYPEASTEWTAAFSSRDCAAIDALGSGGTQTLYHGLAEACRAIADNDADRWAAAEAAVREAGEASACQDRLAAELLQSLVDAHEGDPTARIRIVDPTVSPEAACR